MSHQPSTVDNVRSVASSATRTVADSLDPSNDTTLAQKTEASKRTDDQGTPINKGSYKDQLNEAANGKAPKSQEETYVQKLASYVPGLSSVVGKSPATSNTEENNAGILDDGQAPQRPHHDTQVEEFLKDQYKSRSGGDMPDVGEK